MTLRRQSRPIMNTCKTLKNLILKHDSAKTSVKWMSWNLKSLDFFTYLNLIFMFSTTRFVEIYDFR
jgi:hypothetical protein